MRRLLVLLILAVPTVVAAQGAPPPAPPPASGSASPAGSSWIGGGIELTAAGTASSESGGVTTSIDLDGAFAFMVNFDYQVTDLISFRAMPRYIINIKPSNFGGDSASAFDLRAGVTVGTDLAPRIRGYGLAALGYSSVSFPPVQGTNVPNATGPTMTFGGGASYSLNPRTRVYAELAYEIGFENQSENGVSADFHVKWLELGFGLQAAFGN